MQFRKRNQRFSRDQRNGSRNGQRNFNKSRSFGGRKRSDKKLDINLFVRKATPETPQALYASDGRFSDYSLVDSLKKNISIHGYVTPTAIQEKAIPFILDGKDVIGIANTGTGKTAAFLIPLLHKVSLDRNQRVIIIVPTRELAMQVCDELDRFSQGMGIESVLCMGGADIRRQERRLRYNPQFVIGTPGRLKDLIQRRSLQLDRFQNFVLDEVDRMVDIGFIKDIQYIVSLLPKVRQSLFFSATISDKEKVVLQAFVSNPTTVSVKQQATSGNVDQDIVFVKDRNEKIDVLHDLLTKEGFNKVLVFGDTKWGIEKLNRALLDRGFRVAAIHGNKSQGQRQRALDQFKRNQLQVLLATDVASRGLDIDNVTHVINYDTPTSYEDYVHRIGRTGRAEKKGKALTFVERQPNRY